jgi:hypothetical protein
LLKVIDLLEILAIFFGAKPVQAMEADPGLEGQQILL